eukprot:3937618-Rhodomonas_salina.1
MGRNCSACRSIPTGWACVGCTDTAACDLRAPPCAGSSCSAPGNLGKRCSECCRPYHARWHWMEACRTWGSQRPPGLLMQIARVLELAHRPIHTAWSESVRWDSEPARARGDGPMTMTTTASPLPPPFTFPPSPPRPAASPVLPLIPVADMMAAFEHRKELHDVEFLAVANDKYHANLGELSKCVHDARLLMRAFQRIGAVVTSAFNLGSPQEFYAHMRSFRRKLEQREKGGKVPKLAVIYYSGHSVYVGQELYLIPAYQGTGLCGSYEDIQEAPDILCFPLSRILGEVANLSPLLVVVDSCRSKLDPAWHAPVPQGGTISFKMPTNKDSVSQKKVKNCAVWYSTTKGEIAVDNDRFVNVLVKHLFKPGVGLGKAFKAMVKDLETNAPNRGDDQTPVLGEGNNLDDELVLVRQRKRYILCVVANTKAKTRLQGILLGSRDDTKVCFHIVDSADEPLYKSVADRLATMRAKYILDEERSKTADGSLDCVVVCLDTPTCYQDVGPLLLLDIPYLVSLRHLPRGGALASTAGARSLPDVLPFVEKFLDLLVSAKQSYGDSYVGSVNFVVQKHPEFETNATPVLLWSDSDALDSSWIERQGVMGVLFGAMEGALRHLIPLQWESHKELFEALRKEDAEARKTAFEQA